MGFRTAFRDRLAFLLRTLPPFKGKWRVGLAFQALLLNYKREDECLVDFNMRDGTSMRIDLRAAAERTAFWTGEYDREALASITQFLCPDAVVLDIGANIGFYSIALGNRLRSLGGKVYAFEPVPGNYRRLVRLIKRNDLDGVVVPVNIALGDAEGSIDLKMDSTHGASSGNAVALCGGVEGQATATARVTRLDTVVEELGIETCHFIKMDIEGGEFAFLKGGLSFIRRTCPVIFTELNAYRMRQFGWTFEDLADLLRPLGYRIYRHTRGRYLPATQAGSDLENVFLISEESKLANAARRALLLA